MRKSHLLNKSTSSMRIRNTVVCVLLLLLLWATLVECRRRRGCPRRIKKQPKFRECCENRLPYYWVRKVRKSWKIGSRYNRRFSCRPGCKVYSTEGKRKTAVFIPANSRVKLGCYEVDCVPTMSYGGDRIARCEVRKRMWKVCFGFFGR